MKKPLAVAQFRLQNFKAVRDSGPLRLTPLTVFIGNNGSGKSSLIEGLEMLQALSTDGLDLAMQQWRGFEFVYNQQAQSSNQQAQNNKTSQKPLRFDLIGNRYIDAHTDAWPGNSFTVNRYKFTATCEIALTETGKLAYRREKCLAIAGSDSRLMERDTSGKITVTTKNIRAENQHEPGQDRSLLYYETSIRFWQFVRLSPEAMQYEKPLRRVAGARPLAPDGSNIAEILRDIAAQSPETLAGIIETLRVIVPYIQDIQTVLTSELGRSIHLELTEGGIKLPSWVFSTGTLRLVALLALFRHPNPAPLIVIEEIENGLDPSSIHVILEEIRYLVASGKSQVILTTHSPYLLDLVPLQSIIFVERNAEGEPTFTRPADSENVTQWAESFAPGRLYTMGRFRQP
jgi:predicted ATPase